MSTVGRELRDSLKNALAQESGSEYNELKYLSSDLLSANSFTGGHDKRFGVRPGSTVRNDVASVNKSLTYTQTFEFVLTKGCVLSGMSDTDKYEAFFDLHEIALRFNNTVINTKAGLPSRVLNVVDFVLNEPEFLDDKVAVLTGSVDIIYRLTL